ncbi:MAG: 50S ribosomal protein L3 [Desulfovibrionales bacterium]
MSNTIGLIGTKLGMTRVFAEDGTIVPVTVIQAGPCPIIQRKNEKTDGYNGLQVGFGQVEAHRLNKPQQGHLARAGKGFYRKLMELRVNDPTEYEDTEQLSVDMFSPGERVKVSGTSKGRGFTGVMKRWNFSGLPASHGHEKVHRSPGAIGQCAWPSKVFKGKKMAGQTGAKKVTCTNLEIVDIRADENVLFIRGQVPGPRKGLVVITKQK